jgi:predicted GNAT family N-acyltransferase
MKILPFDKNFQGRDAFSCGKKSLDEYLKKIITQDIRRNLVAAFALVNDENEILGYFTLSNSSIPKEFARSDFQKQTGVYGAIPVTLLGRLAVDQRLRGKGFGKILLVNALKKAYEVSQQVIGSCAIIVDPIDEDAKIFYSKFGFERLENGKMFLPMTVVKSLIE